MNACIQNQPVDHDNHQLYDVRFFYTQPSFLRGRVGRVTCGLAYECMARLLLRHRFNEFGSDMWYDAVKASDNPVVRGFLAEQICLKHISTNGLTAVDMSLGRMNHRFFSIKPSFDDQLSGTPAHAKHEQSKFLYIPSAWNFTAVDGAILSLNTTTKTAHLFPIQFTIST